MKRIFTALVIVPILVAIIGYSPLYLFTILVTVAAVIALDEFFSIATRCGFEIYRAWGHLLGLCLLLSFHFSPHNQTLAFAVLTLSVLLLLAMNLTKGKDLQQAMPSSAVTTLGLMYIPASLGMLLVLRSSRTPWGEGSCWVFFLLIVVWFGDTGAYYVGKIFGRHLLAPGLSPKKTIEGSLGGFLGNGLAALVSKKILMPHAPLLHLFLICAVVGLVSQVGDLSESVLKRAAGIKDSSRILPGHGGMLDRIDGVLFGCPILFVYVRFMIQSV